MRTRTALSIALFAAALPALAGEKPVIAWEFNAPGALEGWQPNGHVKGTAVANGLLRTRAVDWDPFFTSPVFEIQAQPWQRIEFRIKASQPGKGQFFWTNTLESKYAGFSPAKTTPFELKGDGQWETLRIWPFWQAEKKIIRLRFDVYDDTAFEVDYIRILDLGLTGDKRDRWGFDAGLEGWQAMNAGCRVAWESAALKVHVDTPVGRAMAPAVSVNVDDLLWVRVRMKVDAPGDASHALAGKVWCATRSMPGMGSASFKVKPDGQWRVYNVDMTRCKHWQGELLLLAITPVEQAGATAVIDEIAIAQEPVGPPVVELDHFVMTDAVARAGRPVRIAATVRNAGADAAEGLRATLHLPRSVTLVGTEATQAFAPVEMYCREQVTWTVSSAKPGKVVFGLAFAGPHAPKGRTSAEFEFTKPLGLPKADYVPEPKPVACKYDVGVFYFPGWHSPDRWEPIKRVAPIRKPVLGWYDEANPECADWQIKWAVEHGVKFFMVDWYWNQGGRHLEHWLHNAYMNARYRKYLKFCLMWANHNPPKSHDPEDWRKVTQYWIDHYFPMAEYYRIDDRPAVYIWAPANIRRDVGNTEEAAKLYAMSQKMARDAGYKGIYFVAMSGHHNEAGAKMLKAEGYEAFTSYHGFQLAAKKEGKRVFAFDRVVETSPELWANAAGRAGGLRYFPIADSGWSSEPWHGDRARIIHSFTPAKFGALCRKAREYADTKGERIISIGPCNEWGEGSYIEPCAEFGFKALGAMREAFCGPGDYPINVAPVDVGLGPYDLPMAPRRYENTWTFDHDNQGWGLSMGLRQIEKKPGLLRAKAAHRDPAFGSPPLRIRARQWPKLCIRMKVTGAGMDDRCQVFWSTPTAGTSEPASMRLDLAPDAFHDYVFDLRSNPRWRGLVTKVRFDPCSTQGAVIEIDEVRFEK